MSMENCLAVSVCVAVFALVISVDKLESMNTNVSVYVTRLCDTRDYGKIHSSLFLSYTFNCMKLMHELYLAL